MAIPDAPSLAINTIAAMSSFFFMALLFRLGWKFSATSVWRFNAFGEATKADWCSRINSTVHAAVVCLLVVVCMFTVNFDPVTLVPLGSTTLLEITFSISIGYFVCDLAIILWWLLPMWTVFTAHHLVALTPYVITQFFNVCNSAQYVLLLFLLVELSTLPLNAMAFLDYLGRRRSRVHLAAHGVMFVTWFFCRVLLPSYLLTVIWTKVIRQYTAEAACLLPSMICAHIIALFCVGVFCFVLSPELYARLRYGDKDGTEGMMSTVHLPDCDAAGSTRAMEMGSGTGPGAAGGAYHDLASENATPARPRHSHRHSNSSGSYDNGEDLYSTATKSKGVQIVHAFKEGLLPQCDDEGGTGHTHTGGENRSTAKQMR